MEKKKSSFTNFIICFFSILLALSMLVVLLSGSIGKNNFRSWKKQFTSIEISKKELVQTNSKRGLVNIHNQDNIDYGFYCIIETDKTKQEIEAFFTPFVDKANISVVGEKNILYVTTITDPLPLNMDDLEKFVEEFEPEEYVNNIYIVSILKPGRKIFYN